MFLEIINFVKNYLKYNITCRWILNVYMCMFYICSVLNLYIYIRLIIKFFSKIEIKTENNKTDKSGMVNKEKNIFFFERKKKEKKRK